MAMRPALSIVTTLYRSGGHLEEFYRRMTAAAEAVTGDYEMLLVDDGSPDNALEIAVGLCARDPRVTVLELSRNFGHHRAMMTGLRRARGELVFLIDCDLEEEPEWLGRFFTHLRSGGADVVYGVQQARKGAWFERLAGAVFYRVFNALSDIPVPRDVSTARLMRRRYVRSLVAHRDREVFIGGLWAATGYRQAGLPVTKHSHSPTTYTVRRRVRILIDAVTSFSRRPLVLVFYLGLAVVASAVVGAAGLIYYRVTSGFMPGWASLMVSVWMLGGLTLFSIGLVGIYLSRVFMETKRRPFTVVRQTYRHEEVAARVHGPGA
jgi:putative glycosyltransferase